MENMPKIYFAGLSGSRLVREAGSNDSGSISAVEKFTPIAGEQVNDVEIGWDFFLLWIDGQLHISGKAVNKNDEKLDCLLCIDEKEDVKFKQAIAGADKITVLTQDHDLWIYDIYNSTWKEIPKFLTSSDSDEKDEIIKIAQGRCTVALTCSGHVYNVPIRMNKPDSVKFVDVACGYDHTISLAENGDIYSMGMGTRGQLGHGDLEDCDEPRLIDALAGLKVVQISAGGWHSAAVTDQGDLYTWGWNNQGQLGLKDVPNVAAIPTIVDFANENGGTVELNVTKAQCGSAFSICKTDSGELWGCGSNKYGQLGQSRKSTTVSKQFVKLNLENVDGTVKDFKCREWGTCIYAT